MTRGRGVRTVQVMDTQATTEAVIQEARDWLTDCDLYVPNSTGNVIATVDRAYDGGWRQFLLNTFALTEQGSTERTE